MLERDHQRLACLWPAGRGGHGELVGFLRVRSLLDRRGGRDGVVPSSGGQGAARRGGHRGPPAGRRVDRSAAQVRQQHPRAPGPPAKGPPLVGGALPLAAEPAPAGADGRRHPRPDAPPAPARLPADRLGRQPLRPASQLDGPGGRQLHPIRRPGTLRRDDPHHRRLHRRHAGANPRPGQEPGAELRHRQHVGGHVLLAGPAAGAGGVPAAPGAAIQAYHRPAAARTAWT